jgi:hypothetical protein
MEGGIFYMTWESFFLFCSLVVAIITLVVDLDKR